jgi:hypothetical protein
MKTDAEIIARIQEVEKSGRDWLGTEQSDLIVRLSFEAAKPFLNDNAKADDWTVQPRDHDSVLAEAKEYMSFAWGKANNCRGISAGRSLSHYSAWMWLIGEDFGDLTDYEHYGKPQLRAICDRFGWDASQWDDGIRVNSEDELPA